MLKKKKLFCICGKTASGKDTIVNALNLIHPDKYRAVCSYTTRPKRDNEIEGVSHYFVSKEHFDEIRMNADSAILAYTKIEDKENGSEPGYEYMALFDELQKANIYIVDPNGIFYLKERFGDKIEPIVIYVYTPANQTLERARSRSDFNTKYQERVKNESAQFDSFLKNRLYDYIVYNFDGCMQDIVDTVKHIIDNEMEYEEKITDMERDDDVYTKEELSDALSIMKTISSYYKEVFKNNLSLSKKVSNAYLITRNLILDKMK